MGLPIIAVPPAQPPQPYLRHGCSPSLHLITQLASTRLPGRTEARPYDRMVFSAMYYVENKQSRVAACCDLPGDGFSLECESVDIIIVSKIRCRCKASETRRLWVTPGSVPEVLNPVKLSYIMCSNLGEVRSWSRIGATG